MGSLDKLSLSSAGDTGRLEDAREDLVGDAGAVLFPIRAVLATASHVVTDRAIDEQDREVDQVEESESQTGKDDAVRSVRCSGRGFRDPVPQAAIRTIRTLIASSIYVLVGHSIIQILSSPDAGAVVGKLEKMPTTCKRRQLLQAHGSGPRGRRHTMVAFRDDGA